MFTLLNTTLTLVRTAAPTWGAPDHKTLVPHTADVAKPLMNAYQLDVAAAFERDGGKWMHEVTRDVGIGFINFAGHYCEYKLEGGEIPESLTKQAKSVVVVAIKRERDTGALSALVHRYSEPASAWGYAQEFHSFPAGRIEEELGPLNSALNELYEESDGLAFAHLEIAAARFDESTKLLTLYVWAHDEIETPIDIRVPQYYPFATKISKDSKDKVAKPRRRGDFDAAAVFWAPLDLSKEIFVDAGDAVKGRFDCFANPITKSDLARVVEMKVNCASTEE